MNIDDILGELWASNVSNRLSDLMARHGGINLLKRMDEVFDRKEEARNWFFSASYDLGGKRPYDVCMEGKRELAFKALDAYERTEKGIIT